MVDTTQAPSQPTPYMYFRSCELCRQRKVKCDRQRPCSNCARSGATCVYPPGRGRAPKRYQRVENARLIDKLARLESLIQHMASENGVDQDVTPTDSEMGVNNPELSKPLAPVKSAHQKTEIVDGSATTATERSTPSGRESPTSSSLDGLFGRLVIGESKSYYVSNVLWANLANEVDEIRDMLLQPEEEDEDEDMMSTKASSSGISTSNAALFGFCALAHSLQSYHPTFAQAVNLFAVYTENVAPQVRLFHMPTLSRIYWDAIASFESLDKNIEALLFAIYYSAVISIDDQQTLSILGVTKDVALERYRFGVEQAMARADLLNTQSIILLQSAVLFLSTLRSQDESRTTWSLTALIFHIAQTMGIHRDGTIFGLKPFETEMRRRLWWHICILDLRSSEFHGFQPIAHQFSSDTKLPLNVNDDDLYPGMKEFPPVRHEATDMTLLLLRCEALSTAWKIGLGSPGLPTLPIPWRTGEAGSPGSGGMSLEERKAIVRDLEGRLKDTYFRNCDPSNPLFIIYTTVADLIIVQFWLLVYQINPDNNFRRSETGATLPSNNVDGNLSASTESSPKASADDETVGDRDHLFHKAIDVLELSVKLLYSPSIAKWLWYSKPHIQWHSVAFVLGEICSRPPSAECDRAWEAAIAIYKVKGTMWRPIRRLMAKAKYVREVQARRQNSRPAGEAGPPAASDLQTGTPISGFTTPGELSPESSWDACGYTPAVTSALGSGFTGNSEPHQGGLGGDADNALMDLLNLPDDIYTDDLSTFGLSGGSRGFSLGMMGADSAMDGWDCQPW